MAGYSVNKEIVQEVQAPGPFNRYGRPLFDATTIHNAVMSAIVLRYEPRLRGPAHRHAEVEFFYCLQGEGEVCIENEQHTMVPGTAVYVPGEALHQLSNRGEMDLEFLAILVPPRDLVAWRVS